MTEETIVEQSSLLSGWEKAYSKHSSTTLWQDEPISIMSEVIEIINQRGLRTVIDLGCGDGRNIVALVNAGFICAGIDFAKTALIHAQQRLKNMNTSAFFIQGDITNLPFADQSVEVCTCFDVFGQLPEPEKVITEVRRVLIPGGIFVLNAFTPNDSEFGLGEQIGERKFSYKNTLFRFFEKDELVGLLTDWEILQMKRESWIDPPHGDFRPYEHKHENWIVCASTPNN